ncbi:hypothetical protein HMPREF0620_0832 [Parascardovia denticolens DSM 10105 = JCM 12538]|uniref:Rod shape-determining protein RodA n=1 Tax=Parascardovia denticolens DSM 10105 = JCM 12538 TaxID=864564 RepID=E6JYK0_PARDN|nr:DUF3017 domain-containing protein [Parascardovia denticolens]EFT83827.1 hypothetical protein HMPREF0620_0832 [Parascardovia denticolens DSM 10105 = JCM 12538]BAR05319.1 hypothetical protein PSDT_0800 [Parascardovia denticolens DSM 10105 = JCM 12538]
MTDRKHRPYVSESQEGKPWFEWIVAGMVLLSVLALAFHQPGWGTGILAVTAIVTALIRLILRERSPWKVRSVPFDSFIGLALGLGLIVTYLSILAIS